MTQTTTHQLDTRAIPIFAERIAQWQKVHGRHGLPWQGSRDPYRIWLAEIMLQQTQVSTVMGYYERFLQRFPDLNCLANAQQDEVMPYWAGLGYYARARNLHRCAQRIVSDYGGRFPQTQSQLQTLPGIGPSTAAAIAAFAFGQRVSILDGNVKRVLARFAGVFASTQRGATERMLWDLAQQLVEAAPPSLDMTAYTQGLMDLGALVCTRHRTLCTDCPLQTHCYAHQAQCVDQLPAPNPRRAYPTRRRHMLIWVGEQQQLLLQQRPDKGIWGGLLALPEFSSQAALRDFYRPQLATLEGPRPALRPLPSLLHRFTHFALDIRPWLLHTPRLCPAALTLPSAENFVWVPTDSLSEQALPAPIQRLLGQLAEHL